MRIEDRQKLLVILAIAGVALLAGDKLLITPLTGLWKEHARRISELRDNLDKGTALLAREQAIEDRWTSMQKSALPTDVSAAESKVLTAVERWTRASGITFTSIKPQWKQNGDDYKTLECRVDATGDMESLARFVYELERDPLALRVEDLELSARDDGGQKLSLGVRFTGLVLTGGQR
ncbi:MAG: type 4a pilus biogenesis protein PilO [Verrucomicrobiia bacterium]